MLTTSKIITKTTGAKIIIETLKALGVSTIFGYPGGAILDLYDELHSCNDITHVLTRHEQSAVHAAEGYARTTGKCGVVLVTSGPGATNTITGIMNAYVDGYPLVILTGQVAANQLGKDAFQEANICEITKSCTKKTFQIKSASEISTVLQNAVKIATSGKKGPVVIDLVKDIFREEAHFSEIKNDEMLFISKTQSSDSNINQIINLLKQSKQPVIVAGGGVSHSNAESTLETFIKLSEIPVVNTMMGLGTYPQDSKNYFGMIGTFGDEAANSIVKESDLILSLGARFNDKIASAFDNEIFNKIIQVDINDNEISKVFKAKHYVLSDVNEFLKELNSEYSKLNIKFSSWNTYAQELKKLNKTNIKKTNQLHSFEVIEELEKFTKNKNLIFTSEVGQHQLFTVKNLKFNKHRKILVSGGTGTMGFGLPAAIGVAIANQSSAPVVCISGDGSFQMSLQELATCKDYNLNIKILILNNGYLGMVRQIQEKKFNGKYTQTKISNPDFVTLAKSYGIPAIQISAKEDVESALQKAFETKGTYILDFIVEPMEIV